MLNRKCVMLIFIGIFVSQSKEASSKSIQSKERSSLSNSTYGYDYNDDGDDGDDDDDADPNFAESSLTLNRTFKAKDINTNKMVNYCITSIPQSRFQEAAEFMVKYYDEDDPTNVIKRMLLLYYSFIYGKQFYISNLIGSKSRILSDLSEKISAACFKCGSNRFLGITLLNVIKKTSFTDDLDSAVNIYHFENIASLMH